MIQRRAELLAEHQRLQAELEAQTAPAETPAECLAVQVGDQLDREHREALRLVDQELERCQERDQLEQDRPAGCICLGAGGRGFLLPLVAYAIWSEWCSCPDGEQLRAAVRQIDAELEAERAAEQREAAAVDRAFRLDRANLPKRSKGYSWSDFGGHPGKQLALEALSNLHPGGPVRGVYLFGPNGTGKSTLAALAARDWVEAGDTALFLPVPHLLELLRPGGREMAPEIAEGQNHLLHRLCSVGLLVLDDLGAQRETGWTRERLFLIVNQRYDAERVTVITSNYDLDEMADRLAGRDERVEGDRIAWRIKQTCDLVEVSGENYRARPQPARNGQRALELVSSGVEELPF